ncbi:Gx transporter family protein [Hydrogeniiclostridium mannosilyticum]|uniref:Gx transporter family protein n=1 Tax=Hydrogeniiclostridium mannosilyticum TaxID=2764322 RepID=UPI0018A95A1D|nr:Gx transporter family protein [Hydrogeniiclostridium mannosilyticum]
MREKPFSPAASRTALYGLLGALALVLSAAENMIPPVPVLPPGAKLGLSNLVTMFAVNALGLAPALFITLLKSLFAGLTRGVLASVMSLAGGLASTLAMWLVCRPRRQLAGAVGFGVVGAVAHNFGQFWVAFFLTTPAVVYYIPWLLLFGVLSGVLTGLMFCVTMPLLHRYFPGPNAGKNRR